MKEKFFGFYPPNEDEIKDIWENGLIAFDANTLLNLYRYSKETRKDFIDTITEYKDRIWLPFQAGYEFHSNRISVIKSQEEAYTEIGKKLDEHFNKIEKELKQYRRHPLISIEKINKEISTKFNKIKSDLVKQSEKHPEYLKNDAILPEITKLFKDKVGENYSESELNEIYDEGEIRYDKKIPPGFSDIAEKKNKGKRKLYGDLIVWKQLIRKSKSSKNTLIFVTDDRKDDWWLKFKGQTIRPREELIKEFYDETGFRILIYQADFFLKFAKEKLNSSVKEDSINEIKEVRLEDEREYQKTKNKAVQRIIDRWTRANESKNYDYLSEYLSEIEKPKEVPNSVIEFFNNYQTESKEPSTIDIFNNIYYKNPNSDLIKNKEKDGDETNKDN